MAVRSLVVLLLVAAAFVVLETQPRLSSCFYTETAVFSFQRGFSLVAAARGEWDVLESSYTPMSQVLAYRYLSGVKLGEAERKALATATGVQPIESSRSNWDAAQSWLNARRKVPGASSITSLDYYRTLQETYWYYANCLGDAFTTASSTLDDHIRQFGAQSPVVRDWLQAQDQVFQNCSGKQPVIPAVAGPGAPRGVRADRAYQIAAAHFYAADFDQAESLFRDIARDPSSPWREIAPYLAARCIVRRASLAPRQPDAAGLARAEAELKSLLADSSRAAIHDPARKLLAFVQIRLYPAERLLAVARVLEDARLSPDLPQALTDYLYLLRRLRPAGPAAVSSATSKDDLTDWLLTFQDSSSVAADHAWDRWRAKSSLPWLVAAISKMGSSDSRAEALLSAAAGVNPKSPAFPTVSFHSVRLLAGMGRQDDARAMLDRLLAPGGQAFSGSTRNLLLAYRMKLARNLEEFIRDAPRRSIAHEYSQAPELGAFDKPAQTLFDLDATSIFNQRLTASLLAKTASSPLLERPLRREVTLAAWVRAVLLDEGSVARSLASSAMGVEPALKRDLSAYLAATSPSDTKFAAVLAMLRFPGLSPDVRANLLREAPIGRIGAFRSDNWWCVRREQPNGRMAIPTPLLLVYPTGRVDSPSFVGDSDREQAASEREALALRTPAANYLAAEVLDYARSHVADPRVPEALHLVVRATRYSDCSDDSTGRFSKQAFDLLHRRYPQSSWTKQTPYWHRLGSIAGP